MRACKCKLRKLQGAPRASRCQRILLDSPPRSTKGLQRAPVELSTIAFCNISCEYYESGIDTSLSSTETTNTAPIPHHPKIISSLCFFLVVLCYSFFLVFFSFFPVPFVIILLSLFFFLFRCLLLLFFVLVFPPRFHQTARRR